MIKASNNANYNFIDELPILKRSKGNPRTRHKFNYVDAFTAFDIETTNFDNAEMAIMYIWQMQINDQTIIGRTWDDFVYLIDYMVDHLQGRMIIYCHNLSFEFSFLKSVLHFESDDVFSTRPRKVLKALYKDKIEFRCSYMLTGLSLADFTRRMGVKEKLSGDEYDYNKIRYPWTSLTEKELEYCITDVKSLVEALKVFYSIENDTHYTIPLTSTGFVRRDMKKAMKRFNKNKLRAMLPDENVYQLLKEAFRGGNTHANRFYSGMILDNVKSVDRVSSYPDVQINELFPMTPFLHEPDADLDRVCRVIGKHKRAALIKIAFYDIELNNHLWGCPYIPKHKCTVLSKKHYNDNGRIIDADYLEITLTDIDLRIVLDEYDFNEARIIDFYHAGYGKLPLCFREEVLKFFNLKTDLKNVQGEELYYHKAKEKLNSIYGMSVQDLARQSVVYMEGEFFEDTEDLTTLINNANKKAFLAYQWGVWTTAHARKQLEDMIKMVGVSNFIYCDTDSVKYLGDDFKIIESINKCRKKQSVDNGGVASDRSGKKHYLGVWEPDGIYDRFVTMGAKKYAYEQNGKIGITVAGVGKSLGARELEKAGGLEHFKTGFTFHDAGGTRSVYCDHPEGTYHLGDFDFTAMDLGCHGVVSSCYIGDSTYTLGITAEYEYILSHPEIWRDTL